MNAPSSSQSKFPISPLGRHLKISSSTFLSTVVKPRVSFPFNHKGDHPDSKNDAETPIHKRSTYEQKLYANSLLAHCLTACNVTKISYLLEEKGYKIINEILPTYLVPSERIIKSLETELADEKTLRRESMLLLESRCTELNFMRNRLFEMVNDAAVKEQVYIESIESIRAAHREEVDANREALSHLEKINLELVSELSSVREILIEDRVRYEKSVKSYNDLQSDLSIEVEKNATLLLDIERHHMIMNDFRVLTSDSVTAKSSECRQADDDKLCSKAITVTHQQQRSQKKKKGSHKRF